MFICGKAVQVETMRNKANMFSRSAPVSFMVGFSDELVKMVLKRNPETDQVAKVMVQPLRAAAWCWFSILCLIGMWTGRWKG